jgi:hypothetical protein
MRSTKPKDVKRIQRNMRKQGNLKKPGMTERGIRTPKPDKLVDPPFPLSVDSRLK